jgi:hypothetical protein
MKPSSYYVVYKSSIRPVSHSSRYGLRKDAETRLAGIREHWKDENAHIVESMQYPEIFPHCEGSISQAIGGKCFDCGKVLTVQDAIEWSTKEKR